jgi:5-methylcytosine-specific restriction endonuclease McrA
MEVAMKKYYNHRRRMKGDRYNFEKIPKRSQQRQNFYSRNGYMGSKSDFAEWKYQKAIKKQLINSKGAICGICGKPIEDMKHCTIDHIIPLSKGGMTTLENCQLAHVWCNKRKGSRVWKKGEKTTTL